MLVKNDTDSLFLFYSLYSNVNNGHSKLRNHLSKFIETTASTINKQSFALCKIADKVSLKAAFVDWVHRFVELKDRFDLLMLNGFASDSAFGITVYQSIQSGVNQNARASEFTSLFIDETLRRSSKSKSEDDFGKESCKTMIVFKFLEEKDLFERYYSQHLAKRLLNIKNINLESERAMIFKMKSECGAGFTTKFEGMLRDVEISNELSVGFRQCHDDLTIDVSVLVITSNYWPSQSKISQGTFPEPIQSIALKFQAYYLGKHTGRKITWLTNLATSDIIANFDLCRREVNVSNCAMIILLSVFNTLTGSISFQAIKERLCDFSEIDLSRTLQSLSLGKYRILSKLPSTKVVSDSDLFCINQEFTSLLVKIKIPNIVSQVTQENQVEAKETMEKTLSERKFVIECCLVRIMKSYKKLNHSELISKAISQLSSQFMPDVTIVKQKIEGLIERDYIRRDEEEKGVYHYVA